MKKILIIILAIFLAIAAIGAIAVLVVPDKPVDETPSTDSSTDTGSDLKPDTDTDIDTDNGNDNDDGVGPQKPPIILVEDVEELTTALASVENGATIEITEHASAEFMKLLMGVISHAE